ncbi:hypothetical protein D3C75_1056760 [compost metagenome]
MSDQFTEGQRIQWRKDSAFYDNQGEWCDGTFERQSDRCVFIADNNGEVNEYWTHKIEIRCAEAVAVYVKDTDDGRFTARIVGPEEVEVVSDRSAVPYRAYLSRYLDGRPNGFIYGGSFYSWRDRTGV